MGIGLLCYLLSVLVVRYPSPSACSRCFGYNVGHIAKTIRLYHFIQKYAKPTLWLAKCPLITTKGTDFEGELKHSKVLPEYISRQPAGTEYVAAVLYALLDEVDN